MKTYVGNFFYEVTEDELRQEFETFGEVTSLNIVRSRYGGGSNGPGLWKCGQSLKIELHLPA